MGDVVISVRTYLLARPAVAALIGQRFYQKRLPQGVATLPAVTTRIISETFDHALDGLAGMVQTRINFECFGDTSAIARSVADSILWSGIDAIKGVYTGTNIRSVMVEDGRREFEDEDTSGGDFQRHVCSFDLMVHWLKT